MYSCHSYSVVHIKLGTTEKGRQFSEFLRRIAGLWELEIIQLLVGKMKKIPSYTFFIPEAEITGRFSLSLGLNSHFSDLDSQKFLPLKFLLVGFVRKNKLACFFVIHKIKFPPKFIFLNSAYLATFSFRKNLLP